MQNHRIYHVCRHEEWQNAQSQGFYPGSSQDQADGFIHFSTREQVVRSTAKHRSGQDHLTLVVVDPAKLPPDSLKWEPASSGELFPHLYDPLPLDAVVTTYPLRLNRAGQHQFPESF